MLVLAALAFVAMAGARDEIDWVTALGGRLDAAHVDRLSAGDMEFAQAWRDLQGRSLLHLAAEYAAQAAAVEWLAELGVDPNHRDRFGRTPLQVAIMLNPVADVAMSIALLSATDVSRATALANSPLQLAIQARDPPLIAVLAERILAEVNAGPDQRALAADWLAGYEAAEQLQRQEAEEERSLTAAARAQGAARVARVDGYAAEYGQRFPLHGSLSDHLRAAVADRDPAYLVGVIRSLARDWSPTLRVDGRPLARLAACTAASTDVVAILASEGMPLVTEDGVRSDLPVLVIALRCDRPLPVIEAFIEAGALDVSASAPAEALEAAMRRPAPLDVVEVIVEHVDRIPGNEQTVAEAREWLAFERLVETARVQPDLPHGLVAAGEAARVVALAGRGVDVANLDGERRTVLHVAASIGDSAAVHALLRLVGNVDAADRTGETALGAALRVHADPAVVLALLSVGANPYLPFRSSAASGDLRPDLGTLRQDVAQALRTVTEDVWSLHDAATRGTSEHIRQLLAAGLPLHGRDSHGRTPLMLAASRGAAGVVRTLLRAGANPRMQDDHGLSALDHGRRAVSELGSAEARSAVAEIENAVLDLRMMETSWWGTWTGTTMLPGGEFPFRMRVVHETRSGDLVFFTGQGFVTIAGGTAVVPIEGVRDLDGARGSLRIWTERNVVSFDVFTVGPDTLMAVDTATSARQVIIVERR